MYSLRNSLIAILVICLILPLAKADENTYRVDGLPDNLHFESGKSYALSISASNYSAISKVNITVTNGTLSETEDFSPEIHALILSESSDGWAFYWEAPSESFVLGEGNAILSIIFEDSEGAIWSSFESVLRPPELVVHEEPVVPMWALSLAWSGASVVVIVTVIGSLVLRRDRLT